MVKSHHGYLTCPSYAFVQLDKMRAPEELKARAQIGRPSIHREKADVWALGNMFYNVLTWKWVFQGITASEARINIMNGKLSVVPYQFTDSNDSSEQAMVKAIQMAWTYDPNYRPTARQIANYLKGHIDQTTGDVFWRVSVPPLPPNYRYTESDFARNLKM